jgi:protein FAM32A
MNLKTRLKREPSREKPINVCSDRKNKYPICRSHNHSPPASPSRTKLPLHKTTMADDDYHTPGGGLKLKGSKPAGIKKKKKKPSSSSTPSRESALQKAASREEASSSKPSEDDDAELRELEQRDPHDGKTAAERAAEEMRRKRVRDSLSHSPVFLPYFPFFVSTCPLSTRKIYPGTCRTSN